MPSERVNVCLAALFTGVELLLLLLLAPGRVGSLPMPVQSSLKTRYLELNNWDSQHYRHIAQHGYLLQSNILDNILSEDVHADRSNVGFFPAYPLAGRWLGSLTGWSLEVSLPFVAQICCFLFWLYFFSLLKIFGLDCQQRALMGVCVACYPTAFFLVAGYSESLFLAGLLGMIYWTEKALRMEPVLRNHRTQRLFWLLAAIHGFVFSASRLVGIPLVIYPLVRSFFRPVVFVRSGLRRLSVLKAPLAVSAVALCGAGSFFAYCQWQFHHWDLYLLLQQKGWQNIPDYAAIFKPASYLPRLFFEDTMDSISRASIPLIMGLFLLSAYRELRLGLSERRGRLGLYLIAFFAFYLALSGKANAHMDSMSRYTFIVYTLLVLAWAWRKRETLDFGGQPPRLFSGYMIIVFVCSYILKLYLAYMFLRGHWVA